MSNVRCPSCGQYEVVYLVHGQDEDRGHSYCTNCDYGLCLLCCT